MTSEEEIRDLAEALRESRAATSAAELRRNERIGQQAVHERTPHAVIAEWAGLSAESITRIVGAYRKRHGLGPDKNRRGTR